MKHIRLINVLISNIVMIGDHKEPLPGSALLLFHLQLVLLCLSLSLALSDEGRTE